MSLIGYDYAWGWSGSVIPGLHKAGAQFVVRYIGTSSKCITPHEAKSLQASGFGLAAVYEVTGQDFSGGESAGKSDGAAAKAAAAKLAMPAGAIIYFAIDTDTSAYAEVRAYLAGCGSACGPYRARLYAGAHVLDAVGGTDHWQTSAWSAGEISKHASLYQYKYNLNIGGASMDENKTLGNSLSIHNGWLTTIAAPAATPTPAPPVVAAPKPPVVKTPVSTMITTHAIKMAEHYAKVGFGFPVTGECLKVVRTCLGIPMHYLTAFEAANGVAKADRLYKHFPPGLPLFFKGSGPDGHITLTAGNGMCWSSDISGNGTWTLVPIKEICKKWNMKILWAGKTLNGVRVSD